MPRAGDRGEGRARFRSHISAAATQCVLRYQRFTRKAKRVAAGGYDNSSCLSLSKRWSGVLYTTAVP